MSRSLCLPVLALALAITAAPPALAAGPALTYGQAPLAGATVVAGAAVELPSLPGGTVSVTWILDGSYIGVDRQAPFTTTLGAAVGQHELRARILDSGGGKTSVAAAFAVVTGATPPPPVPPPTVPPSTAPPSTSTVRVTDGPSLTTALATVQPGGTIELAAGAYSSPREFLVSTACSAAAPCRLTGPAAAVLSGGGLDGRYGLHLRNASFWELSGFTVAGAGKGIVLDGSSHNLLRGVEVRDIGMEGIHLRAASSDNTVTATRVHDTGRTKPAYGEGLYVGSAVSNWDGGRPDTSDRNVLAGNRVWATGAESLDIKEGTTGGRATGNSFDGHGMSGQNYADSWVDVKGNGWLLQGNTGSGALLDGFQTHVAARRAGGQRNTFSGNTARVDAAGYGFRLQSPGTTGNVVRCDNVVSGAGGGVANTGCTP